MVYVALGAGDVDHAIRVLTATVIHAHLELTAAVASALSTWWSTASGAEQILALI